MSGSRVLQKPQRVHIQYVGGKHDSQVRYLEWPEADALHRQGGCAFISHSLFKAALAGVDIRDIEGYHRRDDVAIKLKTRIALEQCDEHFRREKHKASRNAEAQQ